jgi:hypothetical protein
MRCVGYAAVVVVIVLLSALPISAEPKTGVLCVIPDPPGCCALVTVPFDLKTLMFRIDNGKKTPWPQNMGFNNRRIEPRGKASRSCVLGRETHTVLPIPLHGLQGNRALSAV